MDLKAVKARLEGLSQREKIISALTVVIIGFVFFHVMLYSPASRKAMLKKDAVTNLKKEIEAINMTLASQAAFERAPAGEKITLPEAENLSGMLAAISREANMARVDFISIAPEGFESKNELIELRVKVELRVKFRELYNFLRNIEARHKLFLIHNIKYETNDTLYPSGIALLKAVTYLRKKQ